MRKLIKFALLAETVDATMESFNGLLQKQVETKSIPVFEKDRSAGVAAQNDVVNGAWAC